jgi:hypothetical protein
MVVGSCTHSSATFMSRFLVNIIDEELDDDSVVVGGRCRAVEQLCGLGVTNGDRARLSAAGSRMNGSIRSSWN